MNLKQLIFSYIFSFVLIPIVTANEEKPALGKPARFERIEDGVKVTYIAEIVELERYGQYSWITTVQLPSPRPVYQFRTTRMVEGGEVEQIGRSIFDERAIQPGSGPEEVWDIPWTPSILVHDETVWVLFTRYTYLDFGGFSLYSFQTNDRYGKPITKHVIPKDVDDFPVELQQNKSILIPVDLKDIDQDVSIFQRNKEGSRYGPSKMENWS